MQYYASLLSQARIPFKIFMDVCRSISYYDIGAAIYGDLYSFLS